MKTACLLESGHKSMTEITEVDTYRKTIDINCRSFVLARLLQIKNNLANLYNQEIQEYATFLKKIETIAQNTDKMGYSYIAALFLGLILQYQGGDNRQNS